MYNTYLLLALTSLAISSAYAGEQLTLKPVNHQVFQQLKITTKSIVLLESDLEFPLHFDEAQTFRLLSDNTVDFNLVPVTFNSVKAKNDVCVLFAFSQSSQVPGRIPLHFVVGDGDEVVESCVGISAVTTLQYSNQKFLIYLIRYRSGNSYGDSVFIVTIVNDEIRPFDKLSECVSRKSGIHTIKSARSAIKQCLDNKFRVK